MIDDLELLNMMLEDQKQQPGVYKPGRGWIEKSNGIAKTLKSQGLSNFRSSDATGVKYTDAVTLDPTTLWHLGSRKQRALRSPFKIPRIHRAIIRPFLDRIDELYGDLERYRNHYFETVHGDWFDQMRNAFALPDSEVGGTQQILYIHGQRIALAYFRKLMRIYNYSQKVDLTKKRVAFEIGGGFGADAHLLLQMYPNIRKYLFLEIPPQLYVGTQYLKHFFPQDVVDYRDTRSLADIRFSDDDRREIICISPWQMERAEAEVDLFWSFSSFVHMESGTARNYAAHVKRLTLRNQQADLCLYSLPDSPDTLSKYLTRGQVVGFFTDQFEFEFFVPKGEVGDRASWSPDL